VVQPNVVVTVAPSPLVAVQDSAASESKYRVAATLAFSETAGRAARVTGLKVTASAASGWSSTVSHAVDITLAASGSATYALTSLVDVRGPDRTGVWKLEVTGVDSSGAALAVSPVQSSLTIVDPPVQDAILVGAGDIAACGRVESEATAKLLDGISGTVFTAGDNVYPTGSDETYRNCYGPTWGRHLWRTHPLPGNHDWESSAVAAAYFRYFGEAAAPPTGYYSYELGAWHVIGLNSNIAANVDSAQYAWLKADLAASSATCTIAIWHHPLFSCGTNGNSNWMRDVWRLLNKSAVEVVVSGDDHLYQRFAPQDADGRASATGIREFVVGTGGYELYERGSSQANLEVFENRTFGVIKFTLKKRSYDWEFVPIAGQTFRDYGSGSCITP
jgi:hypothetical protein